MIGLRGSTYGLRRLSAPQVGHGQRDSLATLAHHAQRQPVWNRDSSPCPTPLVTSSGAMLAVPLGSRAGLTPPVGLRRILPVSTGGIVAGVLLLLLAACDIGGPPPRLPAPAVSTVTVQGSQAPPRYERAAFGSGWTQVHSDCDTREVVLERDAGSRAVDTDTDGCRDDGPVVDAYTGQLVDPQATDVDHVVALGDAWYSGAWRWTPTFRQLFANDQANLRATAAAVNRSKGDDGPDEWRPPARERWCGYAATYRASKLRWSLETTPAQGEALTDMLRTC